MEEKENRTMPTTMLIMIWGSFLLISVGIIVHSAISILSYGRKTTIIKKEGGPKNS